MSAADDIERLKLQEARLRFKQFGEADAWALGTLMRSRAETAGLAIVIDISACGRQLFFTALAGTNPDNGEWVRRKINAVLRYHKCSYRYGLELAQSGHKPDADQGVNPIDFAPHGGCFPIHVIGTGIVGTVTVSGVPQRDDHNFVAGCLIEFLGLDPKGLMLGAEKR